MSESQQLFDLVVTGHSSDKPVEALVREILTLLNDHSAHLEFKLSDALLFSNGMVSIRDNISHEEADAIRRQLAPLHVDCDIRPTLQIVPKEQEQAEAENGVYTCPACGHQQAKLTSRDGRLETCEACGIVGERYQKNQRLQQVMQAESQKHENERTKRIREVLERAKQEEEALLQQEARRRLGLEERPKKMAKVMAAAAVVAVLTVSFGTVYYLNQPAEDATKIAAEDAAQQTAEGDAPATTQEGADPAEGGAAGPAGGKGPGITIQAGNIPPEAIAAVMQKAGDKFQGGGGGGVPDTGNLSGGAGVASLPDQNNGVAAPALSAEQKKQQRAEHRARIIEAFKGDAQEPATPADATEKQVKTRVSQTAITEMEGGQLVSPRFQMTQEEHADNRHRIKQYLKLDEADLTEAVIDQAKEAYPRTLLLLDIAEWYMQHQKPEKMQKYLDRIQTELQQTQDITQQALILGGISKAHLIRNEWEEAGQSLQEAIEKAQSLPQLPEQIGLMARLANEQSLFGNQIAARQVLEEANKMADTLPNGIEPRASSFLQVASGYAMLADFAEANKFLPKVEDPAKRQKLAEFIDKLQHQVEQVRAEYQQAAAASTQP